MQPPICLGLGLGLVLGLVLGFDMYEDERFRKKQTKQGQVGRKYGGGEVRSQSYVTADAGTRKGKKGRSNWSAGANGKDGKKLPTPLRCDSWPEKDEHWDQVIVGKVFYTCTK
ncbi:hypothetical protein SODALDRAFT_321812 [Sodiomyces alkalinus F11]|uniref:Uncharacterized protein n=1 Tax=Sodiomyces alkalinus (strain CBS 110278 / VKM F-3762 / F11) TaxID=1314773 RepID=A0A3N2Q1A3_SODAK|nr:hypothetical protein SODALDRAFT_321812 [Sodiomyces alkalinus F11]ROT40468.1 hypothetical protein SODALDRAFT_321812 [Sodiomyces alkalinus F11]